MYFDSVPVSVAYLPAAPVDQRWVAHAAGGLSATAGTFDAAIVAMAQLLDDAATTAGDPPPTSLIICSR